MMGLSKRRRWEAVPGDTVGMVLEETRRVVEQRGAATGEGSMYGGPVCIMQAVAVASKKRDWSALSYWGHDAEVVQALGFHSVIRATSWNDAGMLWPWGQKRRVLRRIDMALKERALAHQAKVAEERARVEATRIEKPDEELVPYTVTPMPDEAPAEPAAPPVEQPAEEPVPA